MPSTHAAVTATLGAAVRAHAAGRAALGAGAEELTYGDLAELTAALAGRLARLGCGPGDRVALLGANSIEWVAALLACGHLGAIAVPLNTRLSPPEIGLQLAQVEPRLVLADAALEETVAAAAGLGPGAASAAAGPAMSAPAVRTLERDGPRSIWRTPARDAAPARLPPGAPALIAFTSGSTGPPKGAVISHGALAHAARACGAALGIHEDDRTLVMAPLFHNTGYADQLATVLMAGGAVDLVPAFSRAAVREALIRRPATYLIAVPGVLRLLTESEDADRMLAACRIAAYGGAPMPAAWIAELADRRPHLRLANVYGLTEYTSLSHATAPGDDPDSVGRPVLGAEQLIVGDDGAPVAAGAPGHILLAGPSRMTAYWRAPQRTRAALRGRWLVTGDVGAVAGDGLLRLVGRASEVINRGGEKVSPAQVEAAMSAEPAVAEAGVVGAPDPVLGERVVAFVTLRRAASLDPATTRRRLRRTLADYAVPERFVVVDDLPRTAAGKLDRHALRRAAAHTDTGSPHGVAHT